MKENDRRVAISIVSSLIVIPISAFSFAAISHFWSGWWLPAANVALFCATILSWAFISAIIDELYGD